MARRRIFTQAGCPIKICRRWPSPFCRDGTLLGGINGGVARSDDDGGAWEAIQFRSPPPLVTCLVASNDDGGCILAGTFEDGIFPLDRWRGAVGGAHNHGLFDHGVYCLALSPDFERDGVAYARPWTAVSTRA